MDILIQSFNEIFYSNKNEWTTAACNRKDNFRNKIFGKLKEISGKNKHNMIPFYCTQIFFKNKSNIA